MTGALGILMFAFEGPTTSAATTPCIEKKGSQIIGVRAQTHCRRFETGGVPGPTSEMSPRAPAQMGRREAEREGGERWLETGKSRGLRVRPAPRSGALAVGVTSVHAGEGASGLTRAPVSSSSPRGQPSLRGPWSFLL
jgi:hypothetical protein